MTSDAGAKLNQSLVADLDSLFEDVFCQLVTHQSRPRLSHLNVKLYRLRVAEKKMRNLLVSSTCNELFNIYGQYCCTCTCMLNFYLIPCERSDARHVGVVRKQGSG